MNQAVAKIIGKLADFALRYLLKLAAHYNDDEGHTFAEKLRKQLAGKKNKELRDRIDQLFLIGHDTIDDMRGTKVKQ